MELDNKNAVINWQNSVPVTHANPVLLAELVSAGTFIQTQKFGDKAGHLPTFHSDMPLNRTLNQLDTVNTSDMS